MEDDDMIYEPYCEHCTIENPLTSCDKCALKITKDTVIHTHFIDDISKRLSRRMPHFVTFIGDGIKVSTIKLYGYVPDTWETMVFDKHEEDYENGEHTNRMYSQFDAMVSHVETVRKVIANG